MNYGKALGKKDHKQSPLIFGEVLFDCFNDGRKNLGGAPFNVAWNLQAFGMSPLLISRVGNDDLGRRIREEMRSWDMDTDCLQVDPSSPTGTVRIDLTNGEPRFTILPNQAYDNIAPLKINQKHERPFLYHGTLALRNDGSRNTFSYLKHIYQCPVFLDVNLRTPWWDTDDVITLIEDATWLKLNEAELNLLFPGKVNMEERCRQLLDRFQLDTVFITLGAKGSLALNRDKILSVTTPQENIAIMDTVGAGDAFSSVLLLGLMHGWPLPTSLQRSQEFASAVIGQRGAITHDKNFYKTFSDRWNLR
ncbi:MAG: carbohydrate kinase [Deltaproteobacteria bacterium]|jgi:fructokinase|nr:carbohydrate kinase [Deltaproteobacteria bacterium]